MIHRFVHRHHAFTFVAALLLAVNLTSAAAWALPITEQFTLSGLVNNPGTFNLGDLRTFTPTTQNVTYQSGSGTTSGSFTGVPIYEFLNSPQGGGGIVQDPGVKNDFLRDYVDSNVRNDLLELPS
ncbi:MAG: hypothetical protein AB7G68_19880 [Nitrospiraceae bacterium]